jgi:OOP family OmpA-OmpF porin
VKFKLQLIFSIFSWSLIFGQTYIYKNDFSDPLINEKPSASDGNKIELKGGFLYCEQLKASYYWCIAERIFLDTEKDFEIEMKLKSYQTDPFFSEFGLVFGLKNVNMFNSFIVTRDEFVTVKSKIYDTETPYLNPYPLRGYKPGDWCVFKIIQKQGRMYFYFNNQLVYERRKIDFMGRWFGWYTNGQTGIQLDHFYIKQDRGQINLLPEWESYKKTRLKGINSEKDEVSPQLSEDGKNLYFAKFINPSSNFYTVCKDGTLGFYSSQTDTSGAAGAPVKIQLPIKNPWYIASRPNQNSFYVGEKDNMFSSTGYQLSYNNSGTIEGGKSVKFSGLSNVSIRHANISKDGSVMIISGYENYEPNGMDLYVSFKTGETWSVPKKITTLNTKGDEVSPYISPDMKKIYFSSDGHPGYGFTDVFVANREDESWFNWSKPMNMGKGINDAAFNEFFVMPDTSLSSFAYLSSSFGNINNLDLYKVRVKKKTEIPTEQLLSIKGKIIYSDDIKEKMKGIVFEIKSPKKKQSNLEINNDEFVAEIKNGEDFDFMLSDTSFVLLEKKITELKDSSFKYSVTIKVTKIKKGESFVLENIYFSPNKYDLLPESYPALDALFQAMKNNSKLKIEVQGHTSKTNESEQFNLVLSSQRASAVMQYLVKKGIVANRITSKGFGYTKPKYTDDLPEHQAANRRVEIKIIEK